MYSSRWFIRKPGQSNSRLYCFSCAGGNASDYSTWQSKIGPQIEICAIQLPGRGSRFGEAMYESVHHLAYDIAIEISKDTFSPFSLFGHSLGALVAFEVTRALARLGKVQPELLFVAGCDAPKNRRSTKSLHLLSDSELILKLRDYNGTPPEVLENQELMKLVLPTIRSDFSLADSYKYLAEEPSNIPIIVMSGKKDEHVEPNLIESWGEETSKSCRLYWFEHGHFFVQSEADLVIQRIRQEFYR